MKGIVREVKHTGKGGNSPLAATKNGVLAKFLTFWFVTASADDLALATRLERGASRNQ